MRKVAYLLVVACLGCGWFGGGNSEASNTNTIIIDTSPPDPSPQELPPIASEPADDGQRQVSASIRVRGVDHETFGSNETIDVTRNLRFVLDDNHTRTTWTMADVRWGGECRVEVEGTATRMADNSIRIDVEARFYEGDDEATNDLEDRKAESFVVPADGQVASHTIQLRNAGSGGGDSATLDFHLSNNRVR